MSDKAIREVVNLVVGLDPPVSPNPVIGRIRFFVRRQPRHFLLDNIKLIFKLWLPVNKPTLSLGYTQKYS